MLMARLPNKHPEFPNDEYNYEERRREWLSMLLLFALMSILTIDYCFYYNQT